jgi:hypothetical protein
MKTDFKSIFNSFKNSSDRTNVLKDLTVNIIAIIFSLLILFKPTEITYYYESLEILRVSAKIILILGLVSILVIIFRQILKIQISRSNITFIVSVLMICSLYPKLKEANLNSISYTLSLIISVFCIRHILFQLCLSCRRKEKKDENLKNFKASVSSYLLLYLAYPLICNPYIKIFQLNILLMIVVYGFYDLVKVKYLSPMVKYSDINENKTISFFDEVKNVDLYAWLIVLIMFLLYNYQFFNILDCQTLYYFYSATAQIFAALLGIVAMFGILILQKNECENNTKNDVLKNGIKGFLIIYITVIILSLTGLLVSRSITLESMSLIPRNMDINSMRGLVNSIIFESCFLMIPVALLYLYAMIVDFLKLDDAKGNGSQTNLENY